MKTSRYPVITAALMALVAAILWFAPPANAQQLPVVGFNLINYTTDEPTDVDSIVYRGVTINLDPASSDTVTVELSVIDATDLSSLSAVNGQDFILEDQTVTFPPGTTSVTIPITIVRSENVENTESFRVNLTNPVNAQIAPSLAQVRIIDHDQADGWLVVNDAIEGQPFKVDIHFSVPYEYRIVPVIKILSFGQTDPNDHEAYNETVFIEPFETKKTIYIQTYQDSKVEGLDRVAIWFRAAGERINNLQEYYYPYIIDDDIPLDVRASTTTRPQSSIERRSLAVPEGGSADFLVWLSRPPNKPVTITPVGPAAETLSSASHPRPSHSHRTTGTTRPSPSTPPRTTT